MSLPDGTILGRYEVRAHLGAGGMGEVYMARDTTLDRMVALKILPKDIAADEQRMQRFIQEAKTASGLNHPNIVTVHEFGHVNSTHFIATEFVDGTTLRHHMRESLLSMGQALEIAIQVAAGLTAAHEAGIVHRDIKPENVMVRKDGYVKVLDFGLAKETERKTSGVDTEAATRMLVNTSPGTVMGTVSYMSPEQTRGYHLDPRTDIWSLGVVLYELVTGHVPFAGETPSDVIVSVLDREPPPITDYLPDAPGELQRIVRKALRKDREERYQSAKELWNDLRALKQDLEFEGKLGQVIQPDADTQKLLRRISGKSRTRTSGASFKRTIGLAVPNATRSAEVAATVPRPRTVFWMGALLGLIVVAALGFLIATIVHRSRTPADPVAFKAMKISRLTATGRSIESAISPDGNYVAHVISDGVNRSLWVRQVSTQVNKELVPTAQVNYLGVTFSPDSNLIYYVRSEGQNPVSELFQVSPLGGDARKVLTDVDSPVTFSPDGKKLAFIRHVPSEESVSLIIANAGGGDEQRLVTRPKPDFLAFPAWSPDGERIAFVQGNTTQSPEYSIVEANVATREIREISSRRFREIRRMIWSPNGAGLLLVAPTDETMDFYQVWLVTYPGGEAQRITNDLNNYIAVSITRDSNTLATVQSNRISNIWMAPSPDYQGASQITQGSSWFSDLSWTPDGRLVYTSNAAGQLDIWMADSNGENLKQLTSNAGANFYPTVSPDGSYVGFVSDRTDGWNIWRMNLDGSNPARLTDESMTHFPSWSPDSKWVFYTSLKTGKPTIWRVPVEGGEPLPVTDKHTKMGIVSPDGKFIACSYWNEQLDTPFTVAIIPVEGGEPVRTFNMAPYGLRWTNDGKALAYINTVQGVGNIWIQPIDGSKPRQVTNWQSDRLFNFAWSSDGKQLAASRGSITSDVILMSDFR